MTIQLPTEPIGSIPKPQALVDAVGCKDPADPALNAL